MWFFVSLKIYNTIIWTLMKFMFSSSTTWDRSTTHPKQKYYAPQVRPDRGSNSRPPDHDSTLHVTETPSLTTRPSVTSTDSAAWWCPDHVLDSWLCIFLLFVVNNAPPVQLDCECFVAHNVIDVTLSCQLRFIMYPRWRKHGEKVEKT